MTDYPFVLYDAGNETPIAARSTEAAMCAVVRDHLREFPASANDLVLRVRTAEGATIAIDGTKLLAWVQNDREG